MQSCGNQFSVPIASGVKVADYLTWSKSNLSQARRKCYGHVRSVTRLPFFAAGLLLIGAGCDTKPAPTPGRAEPRTGARPTQHRSAAGPAAGGTAAGGAGVAGKAGDIASGGGSGANSRPSADCDTTPIGEGPVRFAVIGDYGNGSLAEASVAALVKSWRPDFIVTTGDNNYPAGSADTIDANIGQFFHEFICPYRGAYGAGAPRNRFFPTLGNHDWYTNNEPGAYLDYFALPGNERYYDFQWGSVHVFALDSDEHEPDGTTSTSAQANWLKARMSASTATWKVVAMHHPPYSSGPHTSTPTLQWPYKEWGADLVLAGHDHIYEKLEVDGLPYVVMGVGGANLYEFLALADGSLTRYNAGFGAALVEADATRFALRFYTSSGDQVDELVLTAK